MHTTKIIFLRHGNKDKSKTSESKDYPLSQKGIEQAKEAADTLLNEDIEYIYSSDFSRCKETAEIIAERLGKRVEYTPSLGELEEGIWKYSILSKKHWIERSKLRKAERFIDKILEEHSGKNILIVSHGSLIKGIIFKKLGLPIRQIIKIPYDNCKFTGLEFNRKKLITINCYNSEKLR